MKQGEDYIKKIEEYKNIKNKLPSNLTEIGIIVIDESYPQIYYDKRDSVNYTISFGTILGESLIYYSDNEKWEKHYREMH